MLTPEQKVQILKMVPIFANTRDEVLARVAKILSEEEREPGDVIVQKGDIGTCMYIVLDGQGTFQIGTEDAVLSPGQGVMAPAGQEHGVRNHTQQRLTVLVFVAPNPS